MRFELGDTSVTKIIGKNKSCCAISNIIKCLREVRLRSVPDPQLLHTLLLDARVSYKLLVLQREGLVASFVAGNQALG